MSLFINPLLDTDSYKLSHIFMYPEGLEHVESNFTPRKSRVEGIHHVVQFGLQAYLTDLTERFERFFRSEKEAVLNEYKQNVATFVSPGFTYDHIEALHDLGYLPIQFSALPEGHLGPIGVPSILIKSTHKDFAWLVNYLESDLSASVWHPQTVATLAWKLRRTFEEAARETGESTDGVDFQCHDFSYRGQVNREAARASGAAHLTSFRGSDGVPSVPWINHYYPDNKELIAASVPATEHSVMCASGQENERETVSGHMKKFSTGILSEVVDTWDYMKFIDETLVDLKAEILERDGKLVIRPDSGDPADIICGTEREFGKGKTVEEKGSIERFYEIFGGHENEAGYKVLNMHIGLIYGDGMYEARIRDINARLKAKGFASINWVAGIGSYSYQMVTRDTFGSAVKATYVIINGEGRNIQKNPKTDDGTKKSATGRLAVGYKANGELYLIQGATDEQIKRSVLQPVWENGKLLKTFSFDEVRANLKRSTEILERAGALA
jgi:nicotinamide phosphoribosyltransferase